MEIHASCSVNLFTSSAGVRSRACRCLSHWPQRPLLKKRTCQEYEWVAVKYQRGNGSLKYYVESVAVPPDPLFILKTRLTLSFYATQTGDA
jgi:hypothetical protein